MAMSRSETVSCIPREEDRIEGPMPWREVSGVGGGV